jgi:hypothetical protein
LPRRFRAAADCAGHISCGSKLPFPLPSPRNPWTRAPPSSTPVTPTSSPDVTSPPAARLLISTPLDGPATDPDTDRDPDGRLFNGVTPENFHFLLEKVGFHRINRWDEDDSLGRTDRRWATQLFVLESAASRSLDQIEAILNLGLHQRSSR